MQTPIAILNLWHQGIKTLVSVGGVAFALLLVFMQLGFMGAVSHTATNVLEHLKFDILIRAGLLAPLRAGADRSKVANYRRKYGRGGSCTSVLDHDPQLAKAPNVG